MANVTITLDDEVAQWTRVHAAKQKTSISRWVGGILRERMLREVGYATAMEQFFAVKPRRLRADESAPYPRREELYDRSRLR